MKTRLAVICTRNPTPVLLETVAGLKTYYPEFDIVIVDSASTDKTILQQLETDPACIVEYADNKGYELGAWCFAFKKYPDYQVYMFIQDTLTPTRRIDGFSPDSLPTNIYCTFHYRASLQCGGYLADLRDVYRDTDCAFLSEMDGGSMITGGAHSSFMTHRDNVPKILQLENAHVVKNISKTKVHSWLSERTVGIMGDRLGLHRIDITPYFRKTHGGR
uniref:Glycosyltransferase 2-like domain-containing protein n=1 Tax=viral metagenome TaxID=1070528 RepID=A0A6C0JRQ6_9ZZZZ